MPLLARRETLFALVVPRLAECQQLSSRSGDHGDTHGGARERSAMTRRIVNHTKAATSSRRARSAVMFDWPGACTCRAFSGGRAVHNYGQPGCRYADIDDQRIVQ